jgi:predicted nuclease of predicted toxin-antitoxin system
MRASDEVIISWSRENGYIVFTHDLDFGVSLALTRAESPSVIQVRTQDVFPEVLGDRLVKVLRKHESVLEKGALLTIDEEKSRVRILPFG